MVIILLELTEIERAVYLKFYFKSCFSVSISHTITVPKCFKFLNLKINCVSNNSFIIIGIYQPPSTDTKSFDYLAVTLSVYQL